MSVSVNGVSRHWADRPEEHRRSLTHRPGVTILAYLVLADGRYLGADDLAYRVFPSSRDPDAALRSAIQRLRSAGAAVETSRQIRIPGGFGSWPRGYRLVTLPDDDQLAPLLLEIDRIKTSYQRSRSEAIERWLSAV